MKKSAKTVSKKAEPKKAKAIEFSEDEKAAMKARVKELKAEASRSRKSAEGEKDLLDAVAAMPASSRKMGEQLHKLIKEAAPALSPKTWYGMPAYADADGKVLCFFRPAEKFKERYLTLGFQDNAALDDGNMWPTSYALTKLTPAEEKLITSLVKKAIG